MEEVRKAVEIVCIGQALVDCITRGKEENPHKKNVYRAENISLSTGGDALNQSSILSFLGHQVRLVCGVGKDLAGDLVLKTAKENGIDVSGITISDTLCTPVANLMVEKNGNRVSVNSTATMLEGYEPASEVMEGAKIVSFASLFRAPIDQKEVIIRMIKEAKNQGAIVCADTKMPTYREVKLEDLKEVLPYIDYIFPNENEAAYYTNVEGTTEADYIKMGEILCDLGIKTAVIKVGKQGCYVINKKEWFHVPAKDVQAVDSTGAGDNFVSGFIHGISQGWDLRKCAEFGTECAAISVQYMGATTGMSRKSRSF